MCLLMQSVIDSDIYLRFRQNTNRSADDSHVRIH